MPKETPKAAPKGTKASEGDSNLLMRLIKLILGMFGLKLGSGPPPTPGQVKEKLMMQPEAANKAKEFFSKAIVKFAMKFDYIAEKVAQYLKENPEMKTAIKEALRDNHELRHVVDKAVKDNPSSPMKAIFKDMLRNEPGQQVSAAASARMTEPVPPLTVRSAAVLAHQAVAGGPVPRPGTAAETRAEDEVEDRANQKR